MYHSHWIPKWSGHGCSRLETISLSSTVWLFTRWRRSQCFCGMLLLLLLCYLSQPLSMVGLGSGLRKCGIDCKERSSILEKMESWILSTFWFVSLESLFGKESQLWCLFLFFKDTFQGETTSSYLSHVSQWSKGATVLCLLYAIMGYCWIAGIVFQYKSRYTLSSCRAIRQHTHVWMYSNGNRKSYRNTFMEWKSNFCCLVIVGFSFCSYRPKEFNGKWLGNLGKAKECSTKLPIAFGTKCWAHWKKRNIELRSWLWYRTSSSSSNWCACGPRILLYQVSYFRSI